MRQTLAAVFLVGSLLLLGAPVLAGGFATVRLDEPPGEVVAGASWKFGFTVRQHDVTPTNDVTPVVHARHVATGEEITARASQEGPVGHFVAEMTFPLSGSWKWMIEPQPFPETSLETLHVVDSLDAGTPLYQASIRAGTCLELGAIAFQIGAVAPRETKANATQLPVTLAESAVEASLARLLAGGHAITIVTVEHASEPVACADLGDLSGAQIEEHPDLVLGLRGAGHPQNVGVAVLRSEGERTAVAVYVPDVRALETAPESVPARNIEIVGGATGDWSFQPNAVTIAAGDTVSWLNTSDAAHTITGDDLNFADSGVLDPGQSFRQTFGEPGVYRYRCGPHPWMEAVIIVT